MSPSCSGSKQHSDKDDTSTTIFTQKKEECFKTTGMDDNDDNSSDKSWDSQLGKDDMSEEPDTRSESSELVRQKKKIEELQNIIGDIFQSGLKGGNESGNKKSASTKKNNEGDASVAGSKTSCHSTATHGTQAWEEKHKPAARGGDDSSKKDK